MQIGYKMGVVLIVEPATEDGLRRKVKTGGLQYLLHQVLVATRQDVERGFAVIAVADGNLTRHDIGEGIDKHGGTGETVVRIGNGLEVLSVGTDGRGVVEEDYSTIVASHETFCTLSLQQQFAGDEPQTAQGVQLVLFRIVTYVLAIEGCEEGWAIGVDGQMTSVDLNCVRTEEDGVFRGER